MEIRLEEACVGVQGSGCSSLVNEKLFTILKRQQQQQTGGGGNGATWNSTGMLEGKWLGFGDELGRIGKRLDCREKAECGTGHG